MIILRVSDSVDDRVRQATQASSQAQCLLVFNLKPRAVPRTPAGRDAGPGPGPWTLSRHSLVAGIACGLGRVRPGAASHGGPGPPAAAAVGPGGRRPGPGPGASSTRGGRRTRRLRAAASGARARHHVQEPAETFSGLQGRTTRRRPVRRPGAARRGAAVSPGARRRANGQLSRDRPAAPRSSREPTDGH